MPSGTPADWADVEAWPVPTPVETVTLAADPPRDPPVPATDPADAAVSGASSAVRIALLAAAVRAAERPLLVVDLALENIHPREKVRRDAGDGRTTGAAAMGSGAAQAGLPDFVERDVAYAIPVLSDHFWLVADGLARPLAPETAELDPAHHPDGPLSLPRLGARERVRLAFEVPAGLRAATLHLLDERNGSVALPVMGGGSEPVPPDGAMQSAQGLEVVLMGVGEARAYRGVAAPDGARFMVVGLAGRSSLRSGGLASILELRKLADLWVQDISGVLRPAVDGTLHAGRSIRFPPHFHGAMEAAFLLPAHAGPGEIGIRLGSEVIRFDLAPVAWPQGGEHYTEDGLVDIAAVSHRHKAGVHRVELVATGLDPGRGLDMSLAMFTALVNEEPRIPDPAATLALDARPPEPFVIPPGQRLRFQLAWRAEDPATAVEISGFGGSGLIDLAGVPETDADPLQAIDTTAATAAIRARHARQRTAPVPAPRRLPVAAVAPGAAVQDDGADDKPEGARPIGGDYLAEGTLALRDRDHWYLDIAGPPERFSIAARGAAVASFAWLRPGRSKPFRVRAEGGVAILDDIRLDPGRHLFVLASSGTEGAYELALQQLPPASPRYEIEPNDDPGREHLLGWSEDRSGRIWPAGDRDRYRFSLAARERVGFEIVPPADQEIAASLLFGSSRLVDAGSTSAGAPIRFTVWLDPGDYKLVLHSPAGSAAPYRVTRTRLDPFVKWGDLEPNDRPEQAVPLPVGEAIQGTAARRQDADHYELNWPEGADVLRLSAAGRAGRVFRMQDSGREELQAADDGDWLITNPDGGAVVIRVEPAGDYGLLATLPGVADARPRQALQLAAAAPPEFAAYVDEAQQAELSLGISAGGAGKASLQAVTTDPRVSVSLPAEVDLPGGKGSITATIRVAPDFPAHAPAMAWIRAVDGDGFGIVPVAVHGRCGADPQNPAFGWQLPDAMLGGLDVASAALGGAVLEPEGDPRAGTLIDGVSAPDRGWRVDRAPPLDLVFDLPGNGEIPLSGVVLDPLSDNQDSDLVREFEVQAASADGTFRTVLRGELHPSLEPVAFPFPQAEAAARVRLRILSNHGTPRRVALGNFLAIATPGWRPAAPVDLADPGLGGHVVWMRPQAGRASFHSVLDGTEDSRRLRASNSEANSWVIGFQHGRAARIAGLAWTLAGGEPQFRSVRVDYSLEGPVGPWSQLGNWNLEAEAGGTVEWTLDSPVWARYLRFSSTEPERNRDWYLPAKIAVFEAGDGSSDPSAAGYWGRYNRASGFERTHPRPTGPAPGSTSEPTVIVPDEPVRGAVARGASEDQWSLEVPARHNSLTVTLGGPEVHRLDLQLADSDGQLAELSERQAPGPGSRQFEVEGLAQGTYTLTVSEHPRSIVFAWDQSGSVASYADQIFTSIAAFTDQISPGIEAAALLPFQDQGGSLLGERWSDHPWLLQHVLGSYDRSDASSDVEAALLTATTHLENRPGTRAVILIGDAESPGFGRTSQLWRALEEVRPTVFSVELHRGGRAAQQQDMMQSYAAVNRGFYANFRSHADLDAAFERAACHLRRPAGYEMAMRTEDRAPPAPGELEVVATGAAAGTVYEIILDASGSMYRKLNGQTRIAAAKSVLEAVIRDSIPAGTRVALRAFGHREPRSCNTHLEIPPGPVDPGRLIETIRGIDPQAYSGTPLAASLAAVEQDLAQVDGAKVLLLITDGEESCKGDPAAAIEDLREAGIDIRLDIVGFALDDPAIQSRFARWARAAGGRYFNAPDGETLRQALDEALQAPYAVLDGDGNPVADGSIGGPAISLAPGRYTVRVAGETARLFEVAIEAGLTTRLEVDP